MLTTANKFTFLTINDVALLTWLFILFYLFSEKAGRPHFFSPEIIMNRLKQTEVGLKKAKGLGVGMHSLIPAEEAVSAYVQGGLVCTSSSMIARAT